MPYYQNRKLRIAPEADNLQALFAEAEILAGGSGSGTPKMVELIDTIMSIPSCLQDQQSKIQVVNKWIKEHKNYESNEAQQEEDKEKEEEKEKTDTKEEDDKITLENKITDVVENGQTTINEERRKENNPKEVDSPPEVANSTKRRKNSKILIKSSKSIKKKLKEVDNNIKAITVYHNMEKEECQRPKLLYKESQSS